MDTCLGPVEVALTPGEGEVVLFFPGGHAPAATPLCTDLYTGQGYRALVFLAPRPPGHNGHRQERIAAGR